MEPKPNILMILSKGLGKCSSLLRRVNSYPSLVFNTLKIFIICTFGLAFGVAQLNSLAFADRIANLIPVEASTLAMGNTGIALLTDSYAIFYNPANLAGKRQKARIEPLNIQGDMGTWSIAATSATKGNPFDLGNVYPYIKSQKGEWASHRYSVYPNITTRFLSFGLLMQRSFAAKYQEANPRIAGDAASLRQVNYHEYSPTAALSFRLFGGILKMGYTFRVQTTGVANTTVLNPDTANLGFGKGTQTTVGINQTAGMTITLPFTHLPTIGIVARNIGGTNTPIGRIPQHYDIGVGRTTYLGRKLKLRMEVNHRDVTNALSAGRMRKIFSGLELKMFNSISLRGGYGQGYPSAGLGFVIKRSKVDFAWYSEEMADGLRSDRNQHWLLQFTWSMFN